MSSHRAKVYNAAELLKNPEMLNPPPAVVPRFVYRSNVTLLAAREKDGKSTLATAIVASVTSGRAFLGGPATQGNVLWLKLEEPMGTLLQRLVAFNADTSRVSIVDRLPNGPADLGALIAEVRPLLIVVDTLTAFACDWIADPYKGTEWTKVMLPMARAAQDHNLAVLLLHHARRSDGKYRDSSAVGANVDHILEMQPDASDVSVRAFAPKGRWTIPPFRIRLQGESYELVMAGAELEARILAHIAAAPGGGLRVLRKAVRGNGTKVDEVLGRLLADGRVLDRGDASGKQLWLADACPEPRTRVEADTPTIAAGATTSTPLLAIA